MIYLYSINDNDFNVKPYFRRIGRLWQGKICYEGPKPVLANQREVKAEMQNGLPTQ